MHKSIKSILAMKNPIMPYAWGSHTAIAGLRGEASPSSGPQAELWMGAHDKAPSDVFYQGRWQPLDVLIRQMPGPILGPEVQAAYGDKLPFLFKILAAEQPLSIQVHPDKAMAAEGFARENRNGISLSADHRNYKDDRHKPECICALTTFSGVCGFRRPNQIIALLEPVLPKQLLPALARLEHKPAEEGIRDFFNHIMTLSQSERRVLSSRVLASCRKTEKKAMEYAWARTLGEQYPGDVGILTPFILNLFSLAPGEALFLPARRLHAYFSGLGIEIMAASDNVLRGGLTSKHIDVPELMRTLDFNPAPLEILTPAPVNDCESQYPSKAREFKLSVITPPPERTCQSIRKANASPEILLCTKGTAVISLPGKGCDPVALTPGNSVLVPADTISYEISGRAAVYKACVNYDETITNGHVGRHDT